jgi:hypothetical protein
LAIEHILTHPRAPLWLALTAPWPWVGIGVATYVLRAPRDHHHPHHAGFIQLLKRSARPEADLLHLAPALPLAADCDCEQDAFPIWRDLLSHCCADAAQYGIERVYAGIPDGGPEQSCLAEANFRLYTRESIYRLAVVPEVREMPAGFRRQRAQDSWALQRLYTRSTPILVQQAEGALTGRAGSPPLSWWEPDRWRGVVWTPVGEVRGAVQAHSGRAGHWLRVLGTASLTAREVRGLVEQGLRLLGNERRNWRGEPLPVYATVRDYDLGLSSALVGFGFAPLTDRARFVRHTLAACTQRVPLGLPVRKTIKEVAVR